MIVLIVLLPVTYLFLWGLGSILVTADPLQEAEAIVLLSGGDETRVGEAAHLFLNGYGGMIILTDTGGYNTEWGFFTTDSVKLDLINAGVPANFIFTTEQMVDSTVDEARATRKWMNQQNLKSLIVVTDPYHTFRTRLIFHKVFKDTPITVIVHPVPDHWYRSNTWFFTFRGWRTTIQEYTKLIFYLVGT